MNVIKTALFLTIVFILALSCNNGEESDEKYTISILETDMGGAVVSIGGKEGRAAYLGSVVTITAMPYYPTSVFLRWQIESGYFEGNLGGNPLEFIMPAEDVKLRPVFIIGNYSFALTSQIGGVAKASESNPKPGETVTITAIPSGEDYQFKEWIINKGESSLFDISNNPVTFTMPNDAVDISAVFELSLVGIANDKAKKVISFPYGSNDATSFKFDTYVESGFGEGVTVDIVGVALKNGDSQTSIPSGLSYADRRLHIPSSAIASANREFLEVYFTTSYSGAKSSVHKVRLVLTKVTVNEIGGIYYQKGEAVGLVFRPHGLISGNLGLVMHKKESYADGYINPIRNYWSKEEVKTNANDTSNGRSNLTRIKNISGWEEKYPLFQGCAALSEDGTWYPPALNELQHLWCALNGVAFTTWPKDNNGPTPNSIKRGEFNSKLYDISGDALKFDVYWTSTEIDAGKAYQMRLRSDMAYIIECRKEYNVRVRAIRHFSHTMD